jgi:hypothetical protein
VNLERFGFLGISRNFSASIGSFQGLPAGTSEVILLSQRLALTYSTIPQLLLQAFFTFFSPFFALCIHQLVFRSVSGDVLTFLPPFLRKNSRRTKSAAALRGVTSQPALCDDPPHTGQIDPTQQMLQYDQHGILLSDRPFQPNSPFSKNRSSLVKLPPPKRLSSGPRP